MQAKPAAHGPPASLALGETSTTPTVAWMWLSSKRHPESVRAVSYVGVIYRFIGPSGKTYVGWHACDPTAWPDAGVGRLPDGYGGGGNWIKAARRKHGDAAFAWAIVERVQTGTCWQDVERRHVAAERERVGRLCKNIRCGGDGFGDAEAATIAGRAGGMKSGRPHMLKLWADPTFREGRLAVLRRHAKPQAQDESPGRWKELRRAIERRDAGKPPLAADGDLLKAASERPNPLPPIVPREPRAGTKKASVLAMLRDGERTGVELVAATGGEVWHARNTVSQLKDYGHDIRWSRGRYRLVIVP